MVLSEDGCRYVVTVGLKGF